MLQRAKRLIEEEDDDDSHNANRGADNDDISMDEDVPVQVNGVVHAE